MPLDQFTINVIESIGKDGVETEKMIQLAACFFIMVHFIQDKNIQDNEKKLLECFTGNIENRKKGINLFVAYEISRQISRQISYQSCMVENKNVIKKMSPRWNNQTNNNMSTILNFFCSGVIDKITSSKLLEEVNINCIRYVGEYEKLKTLEGPFLTFLSENTDDYIVCSKKYKTIFSIMQTLSKYVRRDAIDMWSKDVQNYLTSNKNVYTNYFLWKTLDYLITSRDGFKKWKPRYEEKIQKLREGNGENDEDSNCIKYREMMTTFFEGDENYKLVMNIVIIIAMLEMYQPLSFSWNENIIDEEKVIKIGSSGILEKSICIWPTLIYKIKENDKRVEGWWLNKYFEPQVFFANTLQNKLLEKNFKGTTLLIDQKICGLVKRKVDFSQLYDADLICSARASDSITTKMNYVLFVLVENTEWLNGIQNKVEALFFVVDKKLPENAQILAKKFENIKLVGFLLLENFEEFPLYKTYDELKEEIRKKDVEPSVGLILGIRKGLFNLLSTDGLHDDLVRKLNQRGTSGLNWVARNLTNPLNNDKIKLDFPIFCTLSLDSLGLSTFTPFLLVVDPNLDKTFFDETIQSLKKYIKECYNVYKIPNFDSWKNDIQFLLYGQNNNPILLQLQKEMAESRIMNVNIVANHDQAKVLIASKMKVDYEIYFGGTNDTMKEIKGRLINDNMEYKDIDLLLPENENVDKKVFVFTLFSRHQEDLGRVKRYCEERKNCSNLEVFIVFEKNETKENVEKELRQIRGLYDDINIYIYL